MCFGNILSQVYEGWFIFLTVYFVEQKFNKARFTNFCSSVSFLCLHLIDHCLTYLHKGILLCFLDDSVSALTFTSVIEMS